MILDVGCGCYPIGDVNVDMVKQKVKNFVQCLAEFLPFRDKVFNVVHVSHVLEHLKEPCAGLKEFGRVGYLCHIRVPNGDFLANDVSQGHLYSWKEGTLGNLCRLFFDDVVVDGVHLGRRSRWGKLQTLKYLVLSFFSAPYELEAWCC